MPLHKDFWQPGIPPVPGQYPHSRPQALLLPTGLLQQLLMGPRPGELLLPCSCLPLPAASPGRSVQAARGARACPVPDGAACPRHGALPSAPAGGKAGAGVGKNPSPPPSRRAPGAVHNLAGGGWTGQSRGWCNRLLRSWRGGTGAAPTVGGLHTPWGLPPHRPSPSQPGSGIRPTWAALQEPGCAPSTSPSRVGGGWGCCFPPSPPSSCLPPPRRGATRGGTHCHPGAGGPLGPAWGAGKAGGRARRCEGGAGGVPHGAPQRGVGRLSATPRAGWGRAGAGACGGGDYSPA